MNWLKKAWSWLDGKKTVIGSVAVNIATFMPEFNVSILGVDVPIKDGLLYLGMALGGTGLLHKGKKGGTKIVKKIKALEKDKG